MNKKEILEKNMKDFTENKINELLKLDIFNEYDISEKQNNELVLFLINTIATAIQIGFFSCLQNYNENIEIIIEDLIMEK